MPLLFDMMWPRKSHAVVAQRFSSAMFGEGYDLAAARLLQLLERVFIACVPNAVAGGLFS